MKKIDIVQRQKDCNTLLTEAKTMMISSLDEQGEPFLSYSPFIFSDGKFYIYISKISEHYGYIVAHPQVTIMALRDEEASPNLFARERLRYSCRAEIVAEAKHEHIFQQFNEQHGKAMLDVLRGLDFSLFALTPTEGRYVVGFGLAFDLHIADESFTHVVIAQATK
ncbi:HugZ family pyridoxamine 5'-phosphate oxidase [Kurthia sibirica]|uniref:Heme iron utilization protein n=1 Tax=Kurthia sibirica TaxID=202750 RepID=A0A2U3AMD2_9BACL|nr:pyridoxamine 5'-phosphate oxidase family protein [Kurthia sibirica]PWI25690.1 heme iron utilization protein [Kurthia sibirica]GEK33695.1 hypothetical protein KSI01_12280 [Kurthia sibirica]